MYMKSVSYIEDFNKLSNTVILCSLAVHHSIELFHIPTLMHDSLFINTMYVTLLSLTCFKY